MEKESYENLEIETIFFNCEDIIVTSPDGENPL